MSSEDSFEHEKNYHQDDKVELSMNDLLNQDVPIQVQQQQKEKVESI